MTIAEQKYNSEEYTFDTEDDYIGGTFGVVYCAMKYEDGSILVISDDRYDSFTGSSFPVAAFSNFNEFEEWVKQQSFFKYHKTEYKALA